MRKHMLVQAYYRLTRRLVTPLWVMISVGLASPARGEKQPSACCRNLMEFAARLIPVTDSELDEMEDRLVSWLAVTDGPACRRPVLRGAPKPGSGSAKMGRLFQEGIHGLEECEAYLIAHSDELNDSMTGKKPAPEMEQEVARLCADVIPALTDAVGYESNCAPYMDNDDEFPSAHTRMIRLFKAASIWLRVTALDGDSRNVLQAGTDLLRLAQDVTRGRRSGLVPAMISMACFRMVAEFGLREVLNEAKNLSGDALDAFIRELDVLLGTDPGFGSIMEAEYRLMILGMWLPCLRGEDWEVPEAIRELAAAVRLHPDVFDEGDSDVLTSWACAWSWAGTEQMAAAVRRACPDGVLGRECLAGFEREGRRTTLRKFLPLALWYSLSGGISVATFRNIMVAEENLLPHVYFAKWTRRSFDLAALRLHAAVRKHQAETWQCPAIEELTGSTWADLLRDPGTGDPMDVTAAEGRAFKVTPSKLFETPDDERHRDVDYEMRCPDVSHARADDDDVFAPLACAAYVWRESDQGFFFPVLPLMVSTLAGVGETRRALEFADNIKHVNTKAMAYLELLSQLGGPEEQKEVLFRLFSLLVAAGPFVPVQRESETRAASRNISVLATTGQFFARVGLPTFAGVCLELSEQRAGLMPSISHYFLLSEIAMGYALLGDDSECERLLGLAMAAIESSEEWKSRTVMFSGMAGAAAWAGLAKYVDRIVEIDEKRLRGKGEKLDGYGASLYADSYIRLSAVDKALDMARRNENTSSRVRDLSDIADIMLDNGDEEGARKLAAEIEPAVLTNDELLNWRAEAAARFSQLLARLGEDASARKILVQAEEWVADPKLKQRRKDDALADVAAAWCRLGECRKAFELLEGVEDDEDVVGALLKIFGSAHEGRHEFTQEELDAMLKLCPSADEEEEE